MVDDDPSDDAPSGEERSRHETSKDPEQALQGIENRVRKVRHLEAFDYSERDDGRFTFELEVPPEELTDEERETIARLLTKLAADLRSC